MHSIMELYSEQSDVYRTISHTLVMYMLYTYIYPHIPRGGLRPRTYFSLAEILVLVGGPILPAQTVPSRTRVSAWLVRFGNIVHP